MWNTSHLSHVKVHSESLSMREQRERVNFLRINSPWVAFSFAAITGNVFHGWCSVLWDAKEKEMATHSSILAWRIPGTEEPGGLSSMGRTESDTTDVT